MNISLDDSCNESIQQFLSNMPGPLHCYAITITLPPKLYKFQSITQYEMTKSHIDSICKLCYQSLSVPELTKSGNIHYHLVVQGRDKINIIHVINKIRRNRMFGFYKEKEINCEKMLRCELNYLIKDIKETQRVLHTPNNRPDLLNYYD